MKKEVFKWFSRNLEKEMELAVYGHYGYALLLFPAAVSSHAEYERCLLADSLHDLITSGTLKAYCLSSAHFESWDKKNISPEEKGIKQQQYNKYVIEEVIPFIYSNCNGTVPVVLSGASAGAFNAANTFFRNPGLFSGLIAMSGIYDLKLYTGTYFDDNIYFNSPVDYLSNMADESILSEMKNKTIIISSGQGACENPAASSVLSEILKKKNIPHWLDIWGNDAGHDWTTWKKMLPYFLENLNI